MSHVHPSLDPTLAEGASTLPPAGEPASNVRVLTLDGLRGAAVLLVLAHHFLVISPLLEAPVGTWRSYLRVALALPTASGVDLFFVLSGFLVGGILIDHQHSPRLLPTFYLRRFLRIVPLAWLCVFTVYLTGLALKIPDPQGPVPLWTYLLFVVNFPFATHEGWSLSWLTPLWSVAVEEQFYLAFPLVVRAWPARRLGWLGPCLILVAFVSRALVTAWMPDWKLAPHVLMPCRLDAFGCGFIAAWLVRSTYWPQWQAQGARRWWWILPSALGFLFVIVARPHGPMPLWGYAAIAAFYTTILLLVYNPLEAGLRRFFSSAALRVYGKFSYFVYLFQLLLAPLLLGLVLRGDWSYPIAGNFGESVIAMLLPLPVAWLSWVCLERPLLRLGKRYAYA